MYVSLRRASKDQPDKLQLVTYVYSRSDQAGRGVGLAFLLAEIGTRTVPKIEGGLVLHPSEVVAAHASELELMARCMSSVEGQARQLAKAPDWKARDEGAVYQSPV